MPQGRFLIYYLYIYKAFKGLWTEILTLKIYEKYQLKALIMKEINKNYKYGKKRINKERKETIKDRHY